MIPLLPEFTAPPGAPASGVLAQPGAGVREAGAVADFAGLLEAVLPESSPPGASEIAGMPRPAPLPRVVPVRPVLQLPDGTNLPDSGTALPPPIPVAPSQAAIADPEVVAVAPIPAAAEASPAPTPVAAPQPETSDETGNPEAPPEDAVQADPAPALLAPPVAIAEITLPIAQPPATPAPAVPAPPPVRAIARAIAAPSAPPARVGAMPSATPSAAPEEVASLPEELLGSTSASAPAGPAGSAAPTPAPAAPPATAMPGPAPIVAERAEPRAAAPQIESTIAQVGEIREALRAARPEMTLRHAEFGFVNLRIEPAATEGWRAVLASRDPGFVPAVQAALAERAVAALSETSSAGTGTGTGQQTGSDQRYGSSPNSGQGSSSPYLGHSSTRDGDGQARPQHRQPDTTATVAGRAGEGDADGTAPQPRGLFA
jgi:hypothetical protein